MFLGQPIYGKVKSINYAPKRYNVTAEEYQSIFQDYSIKSMNIRENMNLIPSKV